MAKKTNKEWWQDLTDGQKIFFISRGGLILYLAINHSVGFFLTIWVIFLIIFFTGGGGGFGGGEGAGSDY